MLPYHNRLPEQFTALLMDQHLNTRPTDQPSHHRAEDAAQPQANPDCGTGMNTSSRASSEDTAAWGNTQIANFIASDHVDAARKSELAPALFRELATRLELERGDYPRIRIVLKQLLEANYGEFAKEARIACTDNGSYYSPLSLWQSWRIAFTSSGAVKRNVIEILHRVAERVENGRIDDAGTYCHVSDFVVNYLADPVNYSRHS